jgi:hypothetical protein
MRLIIALFIILALCGCVGSTIDGSLVVRYWLTTDPSAWVEFRGELIIMGDPHGEYEIQTAFAFSRDRDTAFCFDERFNSLFVFVRR